MSDSNRGAGNQDVAQGFAILTAVTLCCLNTGILTYAWINNTSSDSERAAYYQQEADRNKTAVCIGREGGLLAECLVEQERASREAYQAESDLNAQRDMSLWAMWMVVISAVTAVITVWALVYVRGTLLATREALEDTGNATNAMVRANEIARETGRKQVRAYLGIGNVTIEDGEDFCYPKITFKLTNNGVSPADVTRVRQFVTWMGKPSCKLAEYDEKVDLRIHAGSPALIPLVIENGTDGCTGEGFFIVGNTIFYKDAFGDSHVEQGFFRTLGSEQLATMEWPMEMNPTPLKSMLANYSTRKTAKKNGDEKPEADNPNH